MDWLLSILVIALIAASLIVWAGVAAKWRQGAPIVPYEPRPPVPWTIVDLFAIAVVYVLTNVALVVGLRGIAGTGKEQSLGSIAAALLATSLANLTTAGLAIFWVRRRAGASWADLGFRFDRAVGDLRLGLLAFAAVSAPVYLLQTLLSQWVKEQHPIIEMLQRHREVWVFALSGVSAVIIAPLAEELFFRVLLQGWLESLAGGPPSAPGEPSQEAAERMSGLPLTAGPADPENPYSPSRSLAWSRRGEPAAVEPMPTPPPGARYSWGALRWDYLSIIVSSLVFSLMHLGHGADPIPLFFLALTLGYLYQRTGRLLPSVVVHFCLNACSMLALCFGAAAGGK
ncbi:MAG TPA: CPBP family intramembrane glutamic endopeptidase [Pirellulales bacterium]|jgi:membrane protease YdiL (CAAX protease family)|nr:CPBP family intramembrane glutamic endopeptidase [Pirellulales bacterium]